MKRHLRVFAAPAAPLLKNLRHRVVPREPLPARARGAVPEFGAVCLELALAHRGSDGTEVAAGSTAGPAHPVLVRELLAEPAEHLAQRFARRSE